LREAQVVAPISLDRQYVDGARAGRKGLGTAA